MRSIGLLLSFLALVGSCGIVLAEKNGKKQADMVRKKPVVEIPDFAAASTENVYQAEAFTGRNRAAFERDERGYTGTGYVDYDDGGWIEWNNVKAMAGAGEYVLSVRYAAPNENGRPCKVFVNGTEVGLFQFPFTGNYGKWEYDRAIVHLEEGDNTVRIKAINRGPHVDKMDVSVSTASPTKSPSRSPSAAPTVSSVPSSTPTISVAPTFTAAPISPSSAPTYETEIRSFQIKLFWEKGMRWQNEYKRRAWCIECVACERNKRVHIRSCDKSDQKQYWLYRDNRIISAKNPTLCIESQMPETRYVKLATCDFTNDKQVFLGFNKHEKFQLVPLLNPKRCLTNEHHPTSGEDLYLFDCAEAEENDGTLRDPYDDTSHWVIGTWDGHGDRGVPYVRGSP